MREVGPGETACLPEPGAAPSYQRQGEPSLGRRRKKGSGREYPQRALGGNKSEGGACPGGGESVAVGRDEPPPSGGWMPAIGLPEGIPAPSPPPPPQREGKRRLLRGKALPFAWESVGIAWEGFGVVDCGRVFGWMSWAGVAVVVVKRIEPFL